MRGATLVCVVMCVLGMTYSAMGSDVVTLTASNFKDTVLKGDGAWIVEFYAPWCGHCKNLAPTYEQVGSALKGVVGVAKVDATAEESLARKYGIQGFPTIKIFGADKRNPTDYQGDRSTNAMVKAGLGAAKELVKARLSGGSRRTKSSGSNAGNAGSKPSGSNEPGGGKNVVTLTQSNFEELVYGSNDVWIVEFYAPWCGHCKNLAPEFAAAANDLAGEVKFGAVDATQHGALASRFGVQGYPTLKVWTGPNKSDASAQDFQGGRDRSSIVAEGQRLAAEFGAPPSVDQLVSQSVFTDKCSGKKTCIVAALPHILDGGKAVREKYLETLMKVATNKRALPFEFLWTEGGAQPEFENNFGLTFGFPAVVAINTNKNAKSIHTGAFSVNALSKFCDSLVVGKGVSKFSGSPSFVSVTPWDGQDAAPQEEDEDDADLMAELMGEL